MHKFLEILGLLAGGGLVTSFAEFHFQYNLIGSIIGLFKKEEQVVASDAKADITAVAKHL